MEILIVCDLTPHREVDAKLWLEGNLLRRADSCDYDISTLEVVVVAETQEEAWAQFNQLDDDESKELPLALDAPARVRAYIEEGALRQVMFVRREVIMGVLGDDPTENIVSRKILSHELAHVNINVIEAEILKALPGIESNSIAQYFPTFANTVWHEYYAYRESADKDSSECQSHRIKSFKTRLLQMNYCIEEAKMLSEDPDDFNDRITNALVRFFFLFAHIIGYRHGNRLGTAELSDILIGSKLDGPLHKIEEAFAATWGGYPSWDDSKYIGSLIQTVFVAVGILTHDSPDGIVMSLAEEGSDR